MKCPLLKAGLKSGAIAYNEDEDGCMGQECAWWYADNACCALLTIAQGSVYSHKALLDIAKKTPLGILK